MEQTEFTLDEVTSKLIREINDEADAVRVGANHQIRGILQAVIRQNGLQGQWEISPDAHKLTRRDLPENPPAEPDVTKKHFKRGK